MAYIEPNSELRLLAGINIDQDYNHTLFFNSREKQATFFKSRTVKTFDKLSYQRKERGYIRVNCIPEEVYGCNYMMYKNTNFDPQNLERWIYCFVESIEYINNNCAEIRYTVDRMQTWMFDYKLGDCLVEREHTLTDVPGEYIQPDDVEPFRYVVDYNAKESRVFDEDYDPAYLVVYSTRPIKDTVFTDRPWYRALNANITEGQVGTRNRSANPPIKDSIRAFCGVQTSAYVYGFTTDLDPDDDVKYDVSDDYGTGAITPAQFLNGVRDRRFKTNNDADIEISDIITAYVIPRSFMKIDNTSTRTPKYEDFTIHRPQLYAYNEGDTYVPRNGKMLVYPYSIPQIRTSQGVQELSYELSNVPNALNFRVIINFSDSSKIVLEPTDYCGLEIASQFAVQLAIDMPVTITGNNIAEFMNRNRAQLTYLAIKGIGEVVAGAFTAGLVPSAISAPANMLAAPNPGTALAQYDMYTHMAGLNTIPAVPGTPANAIGFQPTIKPNGFNRPSQSTIAGIRDAMFAYKSARNAPPRAQVNGGDSTAFYAGDEFGVIAETLVPIKQSAEQIDDYFDRFGYKLLTTHRPYVDEAKTNDRPVSDLRGVWNYIKTVDCVVHHANPDSAAIGYSAQDEAIIASIYNKGITFWFDNEKIGDYNTYRNANSIFNPQPGPTPPPAPQFDDNVLSGIDISRFQSSCDPYNPDRVYGVMDLEDLMTQVAGPQFCIARAGGSDGGDGTIFIDPVFPSGTLNDGTHFSGYATQMRRAKQTKPQIKFGVYWATAANTVEEMQAECDALLQLLRTWNVDADLGVFLDIELPRSYNAGASMCDAIFRKFAEAMEQNGYTPWLYTYRSFFENRFIGPWYRNGGVKVAISAPCNEDMNYVGTPPTEAIDDVSSGAYSFIPTTKGAWQYGKSNRWTDYNGAYMDGDYFYWKGVSK